MSPIGNIPSTLGVDRREDIGECTYNQIPLSDGTQQKVASSKENESTLTKAKAPENICQIVYSSNQNEVLAIKPISGKSKRNTEQRRPGKRTLKDFFPLVPIYRTTQPTRLVSNNKTTEAKQYTTSKVQAQLEKYNLTRQGQTTSTKNTGGIVTPSVVERDKNYEMGDKTNRRLQVELTTEQTPKPSYYRQSKLYNHAEWIRSQCNYNTAGSFFGHSMEQIDNTSVYRVFMQNPNGIDPNPSNQDFQLSLQTCYDQCISFIGLTETNTEWNHYAQRENLKESVKKWWDGTRIQTSTSSMIFKGRYKPGGTASIICGAHWCSRIIESGEDVCGLGRSTHIGLQGNQHTKVLNITWYRVCKQGKENAGTKTAYMQQYALLRERFPDLDPDPRRQSVLDMQLFIMGKIREGYYIILCTEGNENLSAAKRSWCPVESNTNHAFEPAHDGSILTLINTCGLVDILHLQHNRDQYPATYIRGRDRIDGIFVSRQIVHSVLRSGLTPFHSLFGGDHRGVYVDFSASLLFKSNTYEIARPQGRGLQLKDPRKVSAYISALHKQLKYHKVIRKHEKLSEIPVGDWTPSDTIKYERLDTIVVQSALFAEKSIARRYSTKYQWSPALLKEVYVFRYARLRLKAAKGIPVTENSIRYHKKRAGVSDTQHLELDALVKIVEFMRKARKNMKEHQKRHVELRRTYVEELAEAMILKRFPTAEPAPSFYDEQKAKQLTALSNRESAKAMHMKIRSALERNQGGGLSRLDIPDPSTLFSPDGQAYGDPNEPKKWRGPWITITDPDRLETEIIKMNIKQYQSAFSGRTQIFSNCT